MITIERHIAEQENLHKDATGMFSRLIRDLTLSIRIISREVRRAGLNDILGMTGTENIHGESVKKLDEFANNTIIQAMQYGGHVCVLASEECDDLIYLPKNLIKEIIYYCLIHLMDLLISMQMLQLVPYFQF